MLRAIVRNGLLQPLDPLPKEWVEGREIEIEDNPHHSTILKPPGPRPKQAPTELRPQDLDA